MPFKTGNLILDLSFQFSLEIIQFAEILLERRRYPIADQLVKSGTSIGANAWESQNAESKKDFVHKMKIAAKEADETHYWLLICKYSENYPDPGKLIADVESLKRILGKIIVSSKK
ncbi:MAG: four helix bundle protein [Bacteroidota bacterium]|nr:four helix bundle protein [Bacteroidota bacterium]